MTYFLSTLYPKDRLSWALFWASLFSFCATVLPRLINPKGILLLMAVIVPLVAAAATVPVRWILRWERWPHVIRGIILAVASYSFVVTIGNYGELFSFRNWGEFLLPGGASPFTSTHGVAVLVGIFFYTTQRYELSHPAPRDSEQVLTGQPLISAEEAAKRAADLFRK